MRKTILAVMSMFLLVAMAGLAPLTAVASSDHGAFPSTPQITFLDFDLFEECRDNANFEGLAVDAFGDFGVDTGINEKGVMVVFNPSNHESVTGIAITTNAKGGFWGHVEIDLDPNIDDDFPTLDDFQGEVLITVSFQGFHGQTTAVLNQCE